MSGPLVVVGDTLLDVDLVGTAGRLSPDAPVPVLDDLVEHPRPGGAGLAAAMAAADGHDVVLVTALGDDEAGETVADLLAARQVRLLRLPYDGPTPVKKRVRSAGQSLLRLDSGSRGGTLREPPSEVLDALSSAGAVLVADYGRGVTGIAALREALGRLPHQAPVTWDPHPRGSEPVPGVRLVTPNQVEAAGFAARHGVAEAAATGLASVRAQADGLVGAWRAQAVAVTLGASGALLSYGHGAPVVTPAPQVHCVDPCGAGDRFAVAAAVALGEGLVTTEAVQAAVHRAAAYVAAGGPASLRPVRVSHDPGRAPDDASHAAPGPVALAERVRVRGGTVVATGGCFDLLHAGHVATLEAARRLGDCLVVLVNSDDSVRRLKGPSRPLVPVADRVRVLEALECVDAVLVFGEDTPVEAIREVRPHVWAKGGDYAGYEVPEARTLAEWGGQAVVLPYLRGRSTTALVQTAQSTRASTGEV
jgi:D-beta-D-heptose 7-phosphate kinase / D-beta-D-heptose 1-phosphate adenosyltransferase